MFRKILQIVCLLLLSCNGVSQLVLQKTISGGITPKSIVHNGQGLFFAQNMIYSHHVTVYNQDYDLVKTIHDRVNLSHYGYDGKTVKGGPVEAAFSHDGAFAWVSNYTMEGPGYTNPGCDGCSGSNFDKGFLYKINTRSLKIEDIVEVGCVPKFVAVSNDNRYVLVSNWTSGDVSVIDANSGKFLRSVHAGRHPRGIVVDKQSQYAYITIMGSNKILQLNLNDWSKQWIENVGKAPRHLCISPDNNYLYCSINNLGKLVKIDLSSGKIVGEAYTGRAPRSMELTPDGQFLYVVNYNSNSISKVSTFNMKEMTEVPTKMRPIGITLNWPKKEIWVACYSGHIQVFKDTSEHSTEQEVALLSDLKENEALLLAMTTSSETKHPDDNKESDSSMNELIENNYLPDVYIVVGSFSVKSNVVRFKQKLISQGYEAVDMPSQVEGFTYTAIKAGNDPTGKLKEVKKDVIRSAWIYRP